MNKNCISGRITHQPEQKTTNSGHAVCSFTLAVKRPHTKDTTDFVNCTAWRQAAEFLAKYAKKGDLIGAVGVLTSRQYEDKDGNKRTAWEVQVDDVEILASKDKTGAEAEGEKADAEKPMFKEVEEDAELPF